MGLRLPKIYSKILQGLSAAILCLGLLACTGMASKGGPGGFAALDSESGEVGSNQELGDEGPSLGQEGDLVQTQGSPNIPVGEVGPQSDPDKNVISITCGGAKCSSLNVPVPVAIDENGTGPVAVGENDAEGCEQVKYSFTGQIKLSGAPNMNAPQWNDWIIRIVDEETHKYWDLHPQQVNGINGVFEVEIISDLTPQIKFYRGDDNAPETGGFVPCQGDCVPDDWEEDQMQSLWVDDSCDFLYTPGIPYQIDYLLHQTAGGISQQKNMALTRDSTVITNQRVRTGLINNDNDD